jgi:sialate O-acetylesterase
VSVNSSRFVALLTLGLLPIVAGAVDLAEPFTEGMILQRKARVCVWGTGGPGERIKVRFGRQVQQTKVGAQGNWRTHLEPMPASSVPRNLEVRGTNTIRLGKVLVGEVWLAGGQSNMGSKLKEYEGLAAREAPQANHPELRFFTVAKRKTIDQSAVPAKWIACSPETVTGFSATAYFFGRELHEHFGVPVGVIVCAWGGTMAENWISRERLLSNAETAPIVNRYDEAWMAHGGNASYRVQLAAHENSLAAWKAQRKAGERPGIRPREPMGPEHFQRPAGLYESMFRTIAPISFRGIIFYQGESNVIDDRAYQYRFLLPLLVQQWRTDLEAEVPFLTVQLPTARAVGEEPWAEIRESQWVACQNTPKCEMAVVIEHGEPNRLHPKYKVEVGQRLAELARGKVYGESIICQGPLYRSQRIDGNRIFLSFDSLGSGLVAKGGKLNDFAISDASGVFVPAEAVIEDDHLVVSSTAIAKPVAVRYGWKNHFTPSLYNREGYSASPFRTDGFKLTTEENR